jgi:hypothetical protein
MLIGLVVLVVAGAGRAADVVWWEGEDAKQTNFPKTSFFLPQNAQERDKLSEGTWLTNDGKRKPGSEASFAKYDVNVPAKGTYQFWTRKFWKHGPFEWRFNNQPWQTCGRDIALADSVELRTHVVANWVYLGAVELDKGKHTFELRLLAKEGEPLTACFDAFVLTPTAFFPSGKLKPGESSGLAEPGRFSVEPAPDTFSPDALLDLRSMNEQIAGEKGPITRDGDKLRLATGDEVRFFAVNVSTGNASQSRQSVDYLARKLAKLGVNMVRYHSPMWGDDLSKIDPKKLDDFQYLVSAMRNQGIYTHMSFYFPLWVNVKPGDGIDGFDTIQNKRPFGLIYFDEKLQAIHRGWMQQVLSAENPYGPRLADEPALAVVELVNEDSFFFWTFSKQNIPDVQWGKLEQKFGGPILPAWDMTREGLSKGGASKRERMQKQVKFLAELQRGFYADQTKYLKEELGFKGLVVASNWTTADNAILLPIERWTYQAGDIIDKHGYFGGEHKGDGSSYSVRVGHTYKDRTGLDSLAKLPVHMIQENNYPSMISEIGWPQPNRYRTEFAPLVAAFASLQGIDNVSLFAMGSNYVRDTEMNKFQLASPAITATFPASAIMYRRGDIAEATPTFVEKDEADIFSLTSPSPTEAEALDELRKTGNERGTTASGIGAKLVRTAPPAPRVRASDPSQVTIKDGVMVINTPRTKAAIGFLKRAGPIEIDGIKIQSNNDYAAILITSLDDQPIADSKKVLVTRMTDDRPHGFTAPGGAIQSLGQFPFTVTNIDATVDIGWKGTSKAVDFNGLPVNNAPASAIVHTVHTR